MVKVLVVFVGGGAGALLRYLIAVVMPTASANVFPWSTFVTNIVGCFLMGLLFSWFQLNSASSTVKLLLMVGVLGGFTTFSSFAIEFISLINAGESLKAFLYFLASNVVGFSMAFVGLILGNLLFK